MRRTAWDQHTDAFEGLKATFKALSRGEPKLGLPALGGLFARGQIPQLTASASPTCPPSAAIWRLAWLRPEGQPLTRVNWRDMETEELGSVYEGLLELTPRASADARSFVFAEGDETAATSARRPAPTTPRSAREAPAGRHPRPVLDAPRRATPPTRSPAS